MRKRKQLILISAVLLVGCSQEQDTRLVCDCLYKQIIYDSPGIALHIKPKKMGCSDSEDRKSLVFNISDKKLDLENVYFDNEEKINFGEDTIATRESSRKFYQQLVFNRINLKLNYEFGVIDREAMNDTEPPFSESLLIFETLLSVNYQCKVVDGV